jgi:hypothetical protein
VKKRCGKCRNRNSFPAESTRILNRGWSQHAHSGTLPSSFLVGAAVAAAVLIFAAAAVSAAFSAADSFFSCAISFYIFSILSFMTAPPNALDLPSQLPLLEGGGIHKMNRRTNRLTVAFP